MFSDPVEEKIAEVVDKFCFVAGKDGLAYGPGLRFLLRELLEFYETNR